MILIDTHAHIYDPLFDEDIAQGGRDAMLKRAESQQISQIWMPNCARETVPGMMALAEQYPDRCLPMMGLHPAYVNETVEDELAAVEEYLSRNAFMAVGEIGLDFYWDTTYVDQQFVAFETQLRWAAEQNLPVSMHTRSGHDRNAFMEAADVIEKLALPGLTGIFHCFVGTLDEANRAIEMGFKLGIGGVSTFKNGGLDKVLPHVDLAHIVLETDAPYLAPVPYRGKRNEPSYIRIIAQRVADLKQISVDDVARHTTANALSLLPTLYANLLPQ
ncbi:TatD family hydrolase [Spirosoma endbachense]|uniref:YchF/TatD family DNA exonuclease n=1 Tax=Spirosoma endbachense TaxID=2666025 RepID=A0A6P1VUF0_9BACT|nr:TatD family hydrolase [Spirosoma endbachense]QHV96703.1 YchF/TatD family DNA exonuclease [Spirosoma endbachense]